MKYFSLRTLPMPTPQSTIDKPPTHTQAMQNITQRARGNPYFHTYITNKNAAPQHEASLFTLPIHISLSPHHPSHPAIAASNASAKPSLCACTYLVTPYQLQNDTNLQKYVKRMEMIHPQATDHILLVGTGTFRGTAPKPYLNFAEQMRLKCVISMGNTLANTFTSQVVHQMGLVSTCMILLLVV